MPSTQEQAEKLIPAEIRMISGCRDEQTSADVSNVSSFSLPDPRGRAGGACTSAMLQVLYADQTTPDDDPSFQDVLLKMRDRLKSDGYSQIPQLTSSRPLDITQPFYIIPEDFSGTRRAVMIGINYVGQDAELSGCQNDVYNMIEYLKDVHGFEDSDMTVLMDDGEHTSPTRENILQAYRDVVEAAEPGDVVFCHYSGHGAKVRDDNGDEADGYDETLVPLDYNEGGLIRDDDLYSTLVAPMSKGVIMTCVMDCCHSGTVLDLPYVFVADGSQEGMSVTEGFDFSVLMDLYQAYMKAQQSGGGAEGADDTEMAGCCLIL